MIPKLDIDESYISPYIPNDNYNSYTNYHKPYETYRLPGSTFVNSYDDQYSHSYDGSPTYQNIENSQSYGYYSSNESRLGVIDDLENIDTIDLIRLDSYEITMAYQNDNLNLYGFQNSNFKSEENEGKYAHVSIIYL